MQLTGTVRGTKVSQFVPDDGGAAIPFANVSIKEDETGDIYKVKPSDSDDLPEFIEWLNGLTRGDHVSISVSADKYGNVRLLDAE